MSLAEQNLLEAGFQSGTEVALSATLTSISLAYCQQREIVLMLELNRATVRFADDHGLTFGEAMYKQALYGANDKVAKEITAIHDQVTKYRKELSKLAPKKET